MVNRFAEKVSGQSYFTIPEFVSESGHVMKNATVAYKTWGTLNEAGTNGMVICHALSGSADVDDWWGPLLGPGRAFDTNNFFIFCGNVFGSPYGSSSPLSINEATDKPFGPEFPLMTIRDDVRSHRLVLDYLGVKEIQYVIGGSMGGMQVLEWAFFGTQFVKNIIPIATSGRHSAWCISWGEAQRQSIYSDPSYLNGYYTEDQPPNQGLAAARMAALLTYRSRHSFETRFGRKTIPKKPTSNQNSPASFHNEGNKVRLHYAKDELPETGKISANGSLDTNSPNIFSAQGYLRYQGDKFVDRFDANCYIAITRKMDCHDVSRGRGEYESVLAGILQPTLIVGIETDGLFTISEQYELAEHIPNSTLVVISSFEGHDGFLLEFEQMNKHLKTFMNRQTPELTVITADEVPLKQAQNSVFGESEGADALLW